MCSVIEELTAAIIRPPRYVYTENDLGPSVGIIRGLEVHRREFEISDRKGEALKCSLFCPATFGPEDHDYPCIVYCHGNASCRLECFKVVQIALPEGFCVVSFDFAGCGNSEGEYITLGLDEQFQLQFVVEYIRREFLFQRIVIWGRSMGASTALLYSGRDQSLNGIILDSPFASLKQLVDDMAEQVAIPCACCLLPFGRSLVKSRVKKRTGLDIDNLRPIEAVHRSTVPLVIGHGKDDRLISIAQSTEIFNSYPCLDKQFFILPGDHNASRPQSFFQHALLFVLRVCGGGRGGGNSTGDRDNEAPISMNPAFVSSLPLSSSARSASAAKTAAAAATTTTTASSFTLAANPAEDHFDSSDASNSKLNAPSAKEESGEEEVRALSALPNPSVYSSSSEPSLPPSTSRLLSATPSHASSSSASASASASASVSSSSSSTSSSSGGSFISHTPSALVASTKNIQKSKGHIPLTDDANLYMRVEEGKESAEYVEREKELELKDSKSSSILPPNIAITQQTMNRMTPPTLFESDNQSASRPASYNSALSVSATSVSSSPLQSPSSPALSQSFSSSQISHSQNELSIPQPSS